MTHHNGSHGRRLRTGFAATLATAAVGCLALLGGVGLANDAISGKQYGKDKVTICHKGKTLKVPATAVKGHQRHGDTLGPCPPNGASGEKAKGKNKPFPGKGKAKGRGK